MKPNDSITTAQSAASAARETREVFLDRFKPNFETLRRAFQSDDVGLLQCQEVSGEPVAVIIAINQYENGEFKLVPFARMIDGDPYEQLHPPLTKDGQEPRKGE